MTDDCSLFIPISILSGATALTGGALRAGGALVNAASTMAGGDRGRGDDGHGRGDSLSSCLSRGSWAG